MLRFTRPSSAVFLHDLAVELHGAHRVPLLDDCLPVDRRLVRAADVVEAVAEREVGLPLIFC